MPAACAVCRYLAQATNSSRAPAGLRFTGRSTKSISPISRTIVTACGVSRSAAPAAEAIRDTFFQTARRQQDSVTVLILLRLSFLRKARISRKKISHKKELATDRTDKRI